jgi:hypothetical protein
MHGPTVRTQDLQVKMLVQIPNTDLWARVYSVIEQDDPHRAWVYFTDRDYAPVDANMLSLWAYFDEGRINGCAEYI